MLASTVRTEAQIRTENPERISFAECLRTHRNRLWWTQRELALNSGVSYHTIQNWEEGITYPRPGSWQLRKVAEVFRVEPRALLNGGVTHGND